MSKKILVADNSQTIQRAIAIALSDEDVTLIAVTDPGQVVAQAKEHRPDLILLDNRMNANGQDDGYEIGTQLKADGDVGQTPIVFLAGQSYSAEKGDALGAILAIEKPFETQDFAEKVIDLLQVSAALSGEMPAAHPSIAGAPVPRETTAMPTFQPVDPSSVLPADVDAPSVPVSAPLTPPPVPGSLPPSQEENLQSAPASQRSMTPPPLPSSASNTAMTPPPLPGAGLDEAPQTVEFGSNEVLDTAAEAPRRSPLIIPPPSDEAKEFPVKDMLQPTARAEREAPESELEMASPEYIQNAATPAAGTPSFALDPNNDYLAKALQHSRQWPSPAAAPSSPVESAQMDYIRNMSMDVIERVVWEVVPELAEHIIKEAMARQNAS